MKIVEPKVFLVGSPQLEEEGIQGYLEEIGAPDWTTDAASPAEYLVELYGRGCYNSYGVDLNPNITRVREGNTAYNEHIVEVGHGSVFEHTMFNFMIVNCSRVFTHELVRHRIGTAISQQSLRFLRLDKIDAWAPLAITENERALKVFADSLLEQERMLIEIEAALGISEMKTFKEKKIATSAMRRIAPMGIATSIGWSANIRALRHVIEMRTNRHAEEELRLIFSKIFYIMREKCPSLFSDYKEEIVDGLPEITTLYRKV